MLHGPLHRAVEGRLIIFNRIPDRQATGDVGPIGRIPEEELTAECEQFLGGLLKSYHRKAA